MTTRFFLLFLKLKFFFSHCGNAFFTSTTKNHSQKFFYLLFHLAGLSSVITACSALIPKMSLATTSKGSTRALLVSVVNFVLKHIGKLPLSK